MSNTPPAAATAESAYDLSASVWTADFDRAMRLSRAIEAGTVWINTFLDGAAELPFGGYKQSGLGRELGRELGPYSVLEYTETKTVTMDRHHGPSPWTVTMDRHHAARAVREQVALNRRGRSGGCSGGFAGHASRGHRLARCRHVGIEPSRQFVP